MPPLAEIRRCSSDRDDAEAGSPRNHPCDAVFHVHQLTCLSGCTEGVDARNDAPGRAKPDGVHVGVPHHPCVARCCAAGVDVDRELSRPAPPGCGGVEAGAAVVEGGGGDVRGRSRHGNRPFFRIRASLAGVHGTLWRGIRRVVRNRGHLLLPRGDLHRDLHLWVEAPLAVDALLDRCARRDRGPWRSVRGRRREFVDEPASGLLAHDRQGDIGRAAEGHLQPRRALRGPPHDLGGVSRHRVPGRLDLRGGDAAWPAGSHPPARAVDPADGRLHRDADPVRRRRHGRAGDREGPADQVRGNGMRADDLDRRHRIHLREVHVERREGWNRDPRIRLVPRRLEHEHAGGRTRFRGTRRSPAGQYDAALGVRHDGRDLQRADRPRALARDRLVAQEGLPAVEVVPPRDGNVRRAGGGCARVRLDRDRGRTAAMDRLQRHANLGCGHPCKRCLGDLRADRRALCRARCGAHHYVARDVATVA